MREEDIADKLKRAAEAIKYADALLISAGAGMGVDSGLPDFRGTHGFWRAYPVIAKLGLSFEEMANPAWFNDNPHFAWAFYGHRLNLYRKTTPHQGFTQLLEIGSAKPGGYFVFTSNVDGHFQKTVFAPERIVECHGSIHHLQCAATCTDEIWDACNENVTVEESTFRALEPLPRCRNCRALARPNVLMFGDHRSARHDLLSPPLRGRAGEGGTTSAGVCGSPPSLTLPRKGGGNGDAFPARASAHAI